MNTVRHTIIRMLSVIALSASPLLCHAIDFFAYDPMTMSVWATQFGIYNAKVGSETAKMAEIGVEQNGIGLMFNAIKGWEGKYIHYLQTAQGYAEALKAGSAVYIQAVIALRNINDIRKAARNNPQGIGSTLVMSDIYVETVVKFIATFRAMKIMVAVGTKKNMLTGKERTELIWQMKDMIEDLNKKLRMLAMSIAYYQFSDIWNMVAGKFVVHDKGTIARQALGRWKRVNTALSNIYY